MSAEDFADVQRLVLHGSVWQVGRHLALEFPEHVLPEPPFTRPTRSHPLTFLNVKHADGTRLCRPTGAWPTERPAVQISIGFSRRGLAALKIPAHVLSLLASKAPAFTAGAALRSSRYVGTSGRSAPPHWDEAFQHSKLDAVLSLHGEADGVLDDLVVEIERAASQYGVAVRKLPDTRRLDKPAPAAQGASGDGTGEKSEAADQREQWSHFGFRDGLSRIGIEGWTRQTQLAECRPSSIHAAGEFVLGHPQDSGANPYIAGPGKRVWPEEVRAFFRDGSFGVLHQMWQDVEAFDAFVKQAAGTLEIDVEVLKAKLCGRFPDGRVLSGAPIAGPVDADFDFDEDASGWHCPFGSHIRRMNPRAKIGAAGTLAHAARRRALLRRGMPYVRGDDVDPKERCGFVGHFFCASIEDQFEHLVGQWGERVPLGSGDRGGARDPLIGAHDHDDGHYEIPQEHPKESLAVKGLKPFVGVVGTSYLFYPSVSTFDGIVASDLWRPEDEDEADA